jgi:4-hydroxy-tetrahydrodipicolinate synthase
MSLRENFTGTGIAIVTPFLADGSIDFNSLEKLIEFWIKAKVEYLVVLGTTGESATVHGKEKQDLFTFVQKQVNGRVALVAGIGGYDTQSVINGFTEFDLAGYEAILSVAPYYNKPNQEGLFQHYKALDAVTPLPIIMYNVPGRTGQNLTAATQLRVAKECPNVFATKEASGNLDQVGQIIKNKPASFMVISGDDNLTLPMIAMGAEGVTSVVANAFPEDYANMVRLCLAGDFTGAQSLHYKYTDIVNALFEEGSPSGIKAILSQMQLCQNTFRLPVVGVSESHARKIESLVKAIV